MRPDDTDPIRVTQELTAPDRRGFARYGTLGELRVFDRARHRFIGEVSDIGLGGLRLRGDEPIPPARRHALSIEVIVDGQERPRIEVIARCAWHRSMPGRQFESGFEFVELAPAMRERLARFIDDFGL
jgi:hypothetical protein